MAVLVKFYNIVTKHNHYPSRWLTVACVMLEKGKGPGLKKLRILEMIEICLQLVMRACLGGRMNESLDTDKRVSKYNYESRKGHYIENDLLEKTLMFDYAKKKEELNVHAM